MRIFISWAGDASRPVAEFLKELLTMLPLAVDPWVSGKDLDVGERWQGGLAKALEEADYGILCVTRENQRSPWIALEAGALSKQATAMRVVPYLIDFPLGDLSAHLRQFQGVEASWATTLKLIKSIAAHAPSCTASEAEVEKAAGKWKDELEAALETACAAGPPQESRGEVVDDGKFRSRALDLLDSISSRLGHLENRVATGPLSPREVTYETAFRRALKPRLERAGVDIGSVPLGILRKLERDTKARIAEGESATVAVDRAALQLEDYIPIDDAVFCGLLPASPAASPTKAGDGEAQGKQPQPGHD